MDIGANLAIIYKIELKNIMSAPIITIDADKSVEEAMAILSFYPGVVVIK
jgi:predicted transcriptional regulator